jgi:Kef-type K+ transport system membrane component KefB
MSLYQSDFNFADPAFISFLVFGLIWVVVGMLGKVIGCTSAGLLFRYKFHDSLKFGIGMMARAEILIVCAQKGVDSGLIDNKIMMFCLLLILVSSFATPILLKLLYRNEIDDNSKLDKPESNEVNQIASNIASAETGDSTNAI